MRMDLIIPHLFDNGVEVESAMDEGDELFKIVEVDSNGEEISVKEYDNGKLIRWEKHS